MADAPDATIPTNPDSHRSAIIAMIVIFGVALVGGLTALVAFF